MNIDGSNVTRITSFNDARVLDIAWAPDGSKIVFTANKRLVKETRTEPSYSRSASQLTEEIYVIDANGANLTMLTNNPGVDIFPVWSPDSSKIAFISDRGSNWFNHSMNLYVINADGSNHTKLAAMGKGEIIPPAWSPDGNKIVYTSEPVDIGFLSGYEIYTMDADGSNQTRLTNNTTADSHPRWSPDGSKIFYASGANHIGKQSEPPTNESITIFTQ